MSKGIAVVTGGSGYVASWVCKLLVEKGFHVRATTRTKSEQKTGFLEAMGVEVFDGCDLLQEGSFDRVMEGAEFLHHCASPFFMAPPPGADGTFFTEPAVKGTRNVLESAKKAGTVKRVVVTSSCAAVVWDDKASHPDGLDHLWTEDDWQLDATLEKSPYRLSKTLAELEAWKYRESFRIATICPAFICGPVLSSRAEAQSILFLKGFIDGSMKKQPPKFNFGIVDVRDVAEAHVQAQIRDELGPANSQGQQRFILSSATSFTMRELVESAKKTGLLENYTLPEGKDDPELPRVRYSNAKAQSHLGIPIRDLDEVLQSSYASLFDFGIVEKK